MTGLILILNDAFPNIISLLIYPMMIMPPQVNNGGVYRNCDITYTVIRYIN